MKKRWRARCCALFVALALAGLGSCGEVPPGGGPGAKPGGSPGEEGTLTFAREDIYRFVRESSTVWELAQRLFSDTIVYKDKNGQFVFRPVDNTLPRSDYNWDRLVERGLAHREVSYVEEGVTLSIKGIDVSRYQEDIDWEKVAADGVAFAMIRLGYRGYDKGTLVKDEYFDANVQGALKNGVAVGVYFVTQAISVEEGVQEAEFCLEHMKGYDISWPLALDIEDAASAKARTVHLTAQERTDATIAFCETVKTAGYEPMLYCNIRWYMDELDLRRLTDYDKWFAQYFNRPFFPYAFQIWQYSSSGKVDGIKGPVDLNISFVDYGAEEE